jgi:hypothetical protein
MAGSGRSLPTSGRSKGKWYTPVGCFRRNRGFRKVVHSIALGTGAAAGAAGCTSW